MPVRPALLAAALLGLLAVPALPDARAAVPLPPVGTTVQGCGGTSWVAGSVVVCDGRLVHRDYVHDDAGADLGTSGYDARGTQRSYGTLAPPAGDVRYPDGAESTADLVRLELTRVGNRIDVLAELNALHQAGQTLLVLAVDTDGDARTGGGTWPGLSVRSGGWDRTYRVATGDPRTNLLRGSFPLPRAARFRVQAVTAQAATAQVMNVAFRGTHERAAYKLTFDNPSPYAPSGQGAWFEDDQAAALASGDISRFGHVVTAADLRPGVVRTQQVPPGLHERVYTSRYTLPPGEGMSYAGIPGRGTGGAATAFSQVFNFLGKYQPYGINVPRTAAPWGMQMEWHGSNQGIVGQINQPGMMRAFGQELDRVLVTPLARGPNGYGSDISERDLVDVMDDMERTYRIDPSRVYSSGYSQGGYIAFRMAALFPDRFAGYTAWVGFTGDDTNGTPTQGAGGGVTAGAVGNMVDYARNFRHVPGSMVFGGADELVQVPSAVAMRDAVDASGGEYHWYMHPAADHFTFAAADDWDKEAADSAGWRVARPARVVFRTSRFVDSPEYGIRHDRAYWVSGITPRGDGFADTDLVSAGCGGAPDPVSVVARPRTNGSGPRPVPWVSQEALAESPSGTPRQELTGTIAGVAALTVDLPRACLAPGAAYTITSDGPAVLRAGGRSISLVQGENRGRL